MSSLYIVHSSKDRAAAVELKARLTARGYGSVFLDCDPEHGIGAGREWERELYANMRRCRAAIAICSPNLRDSRWCFAEIAHCKALGKDIVPIRITADADHPLLETFQAIDVAAEGEQAYERLWRRLEGEAFWPADRAPYPGLRAFDERDAAVFLGRRRETQQARELLNRLQMFGEGAVLIVGASGSGKSSFLRAGLVPELRHDEEHWLIVGPWRPLDDPVAALALALAAAFQRYAPSTAMTLERVSVRVQDGLSDLCRELRLQAGRPDAAVAVIVDQMEELLAPAAATALERLPADSLFRGGAPSGGVVVVGTLRSDFLGPLVSHPTFADVPFEPFVLRPLARASFAEVIEAPAAIAALELEPGLAATMIADAAGDDALPLLAYSLRELWDKYGAAGRLTIEQYRDGLGGVSGSIRRAAEALLARAAGEHRDDELRVTFLGLASINERGDYVRRPARWDELPTAVHPLLERLVRARLLVSRGDRGGRTVEVAHEALFRAWDRLAQWLEENREFLLWRRRFEASLGEWERTGRHPASVLRGPSLGEARAWLERQRPLLREDEIVFVEASIRFDRREQEEALEVAERSRSAAIAMTAATVSDPLLRLLLLAELPRAPESLYPIGAALDALVAPLPYAVQRHDTGVSFAAMSADGTLVASGTEDGEVRLWRSDSSEAHVLVAGGGGNSGRIRALAFNSRGDRLLAGDTKGRITIWDTATKARLAEANVEELQDGYLNAAGTHVLSVARPRVVLLKVDGGLTIERDMPNGRSAAFSRDGSQWAAGFIDGTILVGPCDAPSDAQRLSGHSYEVASLAFRDDGAVLLSGSLDQTARLWHFPGGHAGAVLAGHGGPVTDVAFFKTPWSPLASPATLDTERVTRSWSADREPSATVLNREALRAVFADSHTQLWTAFAYADGRVRLEQMRRTGPGGNLTVLQGDERIALAVVLDPEREQVVTASADGVARLWRLGDAGRSMPALVHEDGSLWSTGFDSRSRQVFTTASDRSARVWKIDRPGPPLVLAGHERTVVCAAFSPDGTLLATGSKDETVRLWRLDSGHDRVVTRHSWEVSWVGFSPDGRCLAARAGDELALVWVDTAAPLQRFRSSGHLKRSVFTPDSGSIVVADRWGRVQICEVKAGAEPRQIADERTGIDALAVSPDSHILAVAFGAGVVLKALPLGETLGVLPHGHVVTAIAFDAEGALLATACFDGKVRIWDTADLTTPRRVLRGNLEGLSHVEFSRDARYVMTRSNKDEAHLWHSDRVSEPIRIPAPEGAIRRAHLSPDGRWILVQGDTAAHLLPLHWDTLREALRARTRVRLTREQRSIYLGEPAE